MHTALSQLNVNIAVQTSHFQFRKEKNCDLKMIENVFIWIYFLYSYKTLHSGEQKKPPRGVPGGPTKLTENP